jgi:hypothetical protein
LKKNICLVANYTKTDLFSEIAKTLCLYGVNVFWIVVNRKLHDYICSAHNDENVLLLNREAQSSECNVGVDLKLNELVFGDRALRHKSANSYSYLRASQERVYEFIKEKNISFVFGELTWAHELLIHRMCSRLPELGCKYLNPHTVRIPNGRFCFFEDEFQSKPIIINNSSNIDAGELKLEKPEYLALNDKIQSEKRKISHRIGKLGDFISGRNKEPFDPTILNDKWKVIKLRFREELNKELYRFVKTYPLSTFEHNNIVFLGLHKQPEASIDVVGRYYEDQYINILNIWRNLPDGWVLLVKEHTNAIGDRSYGFYNRISKLKDVYMLEEKTDSHEVISKSQLVVTVSGTMAYESAMMGVSSITFAPCFFNELSLCRKVGLEDLVGCTSLKDFISEPNREADAKFNEVILASSYQGIISDYLADPRCMASENIKDLAAGFYKVISSV